MIFERYARGIAGLALSAIALCAPAAPVLADSGDEAMQLVERWVKAFTASDVDGITQLYAADATFIGTSSQAVLATPADIRRYFERALLNNRPRSAMLGEHVVTEVADGTVVVTGLDTVTSVRNGVPTSARGRLTFVIAKRGADWRIVHFHRSALPG